MQGEEGERPEKGNKRKQKRRVRSSPTRSEAVRPIRATLYRQIWQLLPFPAGLVLDSLKPRGLPPTSTSPSVLLSSSSALVLAPRRSVPLLCSSFPPGLSLWCAAALGAPRAGCVAATLYQYRTRGYLSGFSSARALPVIRTSHVKSRRLR